MATADTRLSAAVQTSFALRLTAALSSPTNTAASSRNRNAAFSPLSLHVLLSLLAAGAGHATATRPQLLTALDGGGGGDDEPVASAEVLHALSEQVVRLVLADDGSGGDGGPRVAFADAVFVDASLELKPAFEEVAVGKYKAETRSVDFREKAAQVAGEVNSWVEKMTSGLIKELLPPGSVDQTTRLVLGNALCFQGAWTQEFNVSETRDIEFHLLDGSSVQAPAMTSGEDQYIACYDNFKVLMLPYQQGRDKRKFSMYILLPKARDGLWSLAERLSSEPEFMEEHVPTRKVPIGQDYFRVPRFKVSFGFEASDLLKGLGLKLPFSSEADLSELVHLPEGQNLRVSSIFHKSFVEVNEGGTEADAESAVVAVNWFREPTSAFIADHPFMFLIREDTTGVLLFIGHVVNPLLAP